MDHPNVAKIFDGGTTETGRPYFVMELVRGVSITEYCDTNRLGPRERLELFGQVLRIDLEAGGDDSISPTDLRLNVERLLHEFPESAFAGDAEPGTIVIAEDNRVSALILRCS